MHGNSLDFGKKFRAWLSLLRPLNFLLFLAGVATGGVLAGGLIPASESKSLWIAMLSAALIGGGANAINDYFDLSIDQINRPERPLPSGSIGQKSALITWIVFSLFGLSLSAWISVFHFGLAVLTVGLLWAYSSHLKKQGFLGNLTVAFVVGSSLLYGAASLGDWKYALPGFAFAFLLTLAREVVKDIEDQEGDRLNETTSLALQFGTRRASRVAQSILILTIVLSPFPHTFLSYGGWFLSLIAVLCVTLLAMILQLNGHNLNKQSYTVVSHRLKASMIVGMTALCLSGF